MATNKHIVLTKDGLITKIAELTGEKRTVCGRVVDAYPQVIQEALLKNLPKKGEISAVGLPGLGTIGVKVVPETVRKNNFTGQNQTIPEHFMPTFKITKTLKVALNAELVKSAQAGGAKKAGKKTA